MPHVRTCGMVMQATPKFQHGCVEEQPLLPPGGREVFRLRKLLPQTQDYDFNVHVMDFSPGEYLYIKASDGIHWHGCWCIAAVPASASVGW